MIRKKGGRIALALGAVFVAGTALAQFPRWGQQPRRERAPAVESANVPYDGRFVFVRLRYGSDLVAVGRFRRDPPWAHDYPRAERHLVRILSELTFIRPYLDGGNVLALDDPELGNFPVAYMSEPGFWVLTDAEADGLRAYLLKGGFVIFDDFRGRDLQNFQAQLGRVLPEARLVELDASHPIFHSFFEIESLDFVQFYESRASAIFYGVFEDNDPARRLMIVANYNNDIGEYWEFSDTEWVPIDLSNEAYKFGVNYMVYAMAH